MNHFFHHIQEYWYLIIFIVGATIAILYNVRYKIPNLEDRVKEIESKLEDKDGNPMYTQAKVCNKLREDNMTKQAKEREDFCDKVDKMESKLSKQIKDADDKREKAKTDLSSTVSELSINVAKVAQKVEDMVTINQKNNVDNVIEKFADVLAQKFEMLFKRQINNKTG